MLKVKKLNEDAVLPTIAHIGEDMCYDLYSCEDVFLEYGKPTPVRCGIAAQYKSPFGTFGLIVKDRSSMAKKGIFTTAGVIDAGYTGEMIVFLTDQINRGMPYLINKGNKVAQMYPQKIYADGVEEVENLEGERGENGFGSSGT